LILSDKICLAELSKSAGRCQAAAAAPWRAGAGGEAVSPLWLPAGKGAQYNFYVIEGIIFIDFVYFAYYERLK